MIKEWMAERTREDVLEVFERHEAAIGPVYDTRDIFEDEYFWERGALEEVPDESYENLVMPGVVPHLSATPGEIEHAGRALGADTLDVLSEVAGLTAAEIEALAERGVVRLG